MNNEQLRLYAGCRPKKPEQKHEQTRTKHRTRQQKVICYSVAGETHSS